MNPIIVFLEDDPDVQTVLPSLVWYAGFDATETVVTDDNLGFIPFLDTLPVPDVIFMNLRMSDKNGYLLLCDIASRTRTEDRAYNPNCI